MHLNAPFQGRRLLETNKGRKNPKGRNVDYLLPDMALRPLVAQPITHRINQVKECVSIFWPVSVSV
jgi:hypothetical protein